MQDDPRDHQPQPQQKKGGGGAGERVIGEGVGGLALCC